MNRRTNVLLWLALAALIVLAAYLRLHGISDKSFWTDESVSVAFTRLDWYDLVRILWRREENMTLYYLLLRGWSHLGDSEAMFRGFSVLWSVATVPVLYALGRRLFNPLAGLVAALLWTLNAYSVRYAQEVRSYSMVVFLVTLATYFLALAIQSPHNQDERKDTSFWRLYVVCSTLAIYAHFFAVLVVVAHAVAFWRTPAKPRVIRATKLIALWTIPIWLFIATTGAGPIAWISRPTLKLLWTMLGDQAGHGGLFLSLLYLLAIALAAMGAPSFPFFGKGGTLTEKANLLMLFWWWLLPIAITFLVSLIRPMLLSRYLIIVVPAMILIVAAGIESLKPHFVGIAVLVAVCWFAVGGVRSYYRSDFDLAREDFRSATQHVLVNAKPDDGIVLYRAQNRFAYSYYVDRQADGKAKPTILYPGTEKPEWRDFIARVTPATLDSIERHNGRLWLLISESSCSKDEDAVTVQLRTSAASTHRLAEAKQLENLCLYLYR